MAAFCKTNTKIDNSIAFISLIIFSFFIATVEEISFLCFIPIVVQAIILSVNLKKILTKIIKINLFIIITFIILALENKYDLAILVFLRANLILWFTLSFNFDGFRLYKALNNLKVSNKFSLLLFFTVKYIEILFVNAIRLKKLSLIRGFHPKFNKRTFKTYGDIFAYLLYISINKMQKVEDLIMIRTTNNRLAPPKKIKIRTKELSLISSILGVIFVYYFI